MMLTVALVLSSLASLATAQFPPEPEGITILKSKFHENVTISFKEPGICETTPGVKSYAGYVHLPPGFLDDGAGEVQDYPINTFFWFFEARKDPLNAPLAIWLNGGPGASSMMGLLEENGPCFVGPDSKSTYLNPWSWNNEVNMLYLDQPAQVGFSYDVRTNGTQQFEQSDRDMVTIPVDFSDGVPESNWTFQVGTFSSQDPSRTASTTLSAAHALWHFAQSWFFEFPHYKPTDDRISLWAESYGGHYGPGFMSFFQEQNDKIANGSSQERDAHYLHLDTLGIVNGLMDLAVQAEAYIEFAYNNTYGIEVINKTTYETMMHNFNKPGGCRDRTLQCEDALRTSDRNATEICARTQEDCFVTLTRNYTAEDRGWYDISHPGADPFPPPGMYGFLAQEETLQALGVPVNFSSRSMAVNGNFIKSLDLARGGFLNAIGYLLDSGVKVHMMYGDRDFACNWLGGERASLHVKYSQSANFADAGYFPLITSHGVDGMTRQYGNFSFTRVFQAGHEVPSYQPEAAYRIFMRATLGKDIATGMVTTHDEFKTLGPKDTWWFKNIPPEMPEPKCYVLKPESCTPDVWTRVAAGSATVKDYFVVDEDDETEEYKKILLMQNEASQAVMEEL